MQDSTSTFQILETMASLVLERGSSQTEAIPQESPASKLKTVTENLGKLLEAAQKVKKQSLSPEVIQKLKKQKALKQRIALYKAEIESKKALLTPEEPRQITVRFELEPVLPDSASDLEAGPANPDKSERKCSFELLGDIPTDSPQQILLQSLKQRLEAVQTSHALAQRQVLEYRAFLAERAKEFYSEDPYHSKFDVRDSWLEWIVQDAAKSDFSMATFVQDNSQNSIQHGNGPLFDITDDQSRDKRTRLGSDDPNSKMNVMQTKFVQIPDDQTRLGQWEEKLLGEVTSEQLRQICVFLFPKPVTKSASWRRILEAEPSLCARVRLKGRPSS